MSGHAHIIVVTVEDESHSSDKDDSTGLEKTTATEMCTACGRPVKDHVEAGSEFGPECKWRRQEPTPAANSREQPVDTSDVTSPPEAVPEGSSPPHTVSEDEIARMQAERDKLLHQYEVNRLQQEISTLRAALGTPRTDLTPPSQALGATVGDPNGPPPTSITPSHPITLPDVKHQPKIQTALRKLSTSVQVLNNILGHSTNGDAYNGDLETLDTDRWSPSSNFNEKDRDPNSVESRTGYLKKRLAVQTHRLRHLSRKHNETRVGIDHVRDWLENSHAAQAVDEVKCGSTDSGVRSPAISPVSQFSGSKPDVNNIDGHRQRQRRGEHIDYLAPSTGVRSPAVSPTSPFGGSMQDVNSNAGQRHQSRISARSQSFQLGQQRPSADTIMPHDQGVTRAEAIMRRRTVQNERVAYWNSKLILNEEKRIQKSVVQNWLDNCHTEQTPIDRGRHYSDTSGGQKESPDVAMSNSSHFGGSMPDLLNYKGKDHHGSLRSHGTTDGLDAIGEGVEEPPPEDANDEHIEARNPKGQAAKPRDSLPSTQRKDDGKRPNRKIKATNACQDLATSGEVSRRPSAPTHQSRKHQSVRSRDRDSKSPRGVEVRTTADIVSHFFEDERIPKTDRRPGHDPKDNEGTVILDSFDKIKEYLGRKSPFRRANIQKSRMSGIRNHNKTIEIQENLGAPLEAKRNLAAPLEVLGENTAPLEVQEDAAVPLEVQRNPVISLEEIGQLKEEGRQRMNQVHVLTRRVARDLWTLIGTDPTGVNVRVHETKAN
ncbi:Hypp5976 [Branchiostoma lanceolatum]|uniref:Hypp5976 protein n=1 Tax=Branchiostoma lanceolatum TaxID=7740 RepID=A0A8J9VI22_BRALA|nr:Hypp5976 [Branchiostoma lanceolatum]